jgi:chromosome segregation ATPase
VIAEEKRLIGIITPEESRIRTLREAYEAEQERIRQELARQEAERIAAIRERIAGFQSLVLLATGASSTEVAEIVARLEAIRIDDTYQELRREAEIALTAALDSARKLLASIQTREQEAAEARAKAEAEAEQRRKETEELERLRAEQARQSKELARQQAEIERQQQEAEAKLAAERAEIERQKQEIEARQRAEEEAKARAETEARALAEEKAAEIKVSKSEPEPDPVPKPSLAEEISEWRKRYKITKTAFDALMAILAHH